MISFHKVFPMYFIIRDHKYIDMTPKEASRLKFKIGWEFGYLNQVRLLCNQGDPDNCCAEPWPRS